MLYIYPFFQGVGQADLRAGRLTRVEYVSGGVKMYQTWRFENRIDRRHDADLRGHQRRGHGLGERDD